MSVLDTTIAGRRLLENVVIPKAYAAIFGSSVLPTLSNFDNTKRALINAFIAVEKVQGSPVGAEYIATMIGQNEMTARYGPSDLSQLNPWIPNVLPNFGAQLPSDFRILAVDSTSGAMAVAAPTDDTGKNNLVILTPFTNPISGGESSVFRARVLEWPDDQPPLASAFEHALLSASSSASSQISDGGQGNSWSDDLPADDVEEIIFAQILGQSGAGPNGAPLGDDAYDAVFLIPQGFGPGKVAPFPYPAALASATTESEVLAALSDVIAAINGIELPVIDFVPANDEGNFGIYSGGLNALNGPQIAAFLLGLPLDHSFSDGVTLDSVLDGQVSVVSGLTLRIPDHLNLKEIARGTTPDGNGFIALIPESEDDSTVIWTLPGISAAVLNAVPSQIKIVQGGTETNLADLKPFGPLLNPADISGQQVDGTDLAEEIDASFTDANGDQLTGGHDTVFALDGDDTIHNSFGNDVIDGGAGHDTVYYGQFAFDGFWVEGDSTFVIEQEYASGRFEVDRLTNVERLSFADGSYATFTLGETSASITQYSADGSQIIGLAERDWSPTGLFNARYQEFTNGVLTQFYLRQKDGLRIEKEFDSDGRKTMQRTRDGDDNFDWTYKLRQFQNSELIYSRTVYDDSTREEFTYSGDDLIRSHISDDKPETDWASISKEFDIFGFVSSEKISYDNDDFVSRSFSYGDLAEVSLFDGDQSETWLSRSVRYDPGTGVVMRKSVTNHDGSSHYLDINPYTRTRVVSETDRMGPDGDNGEHPWQHKHWSYSGTGQLTYKSTTYDNGDYESYNYNSGSLSFVYKRDGDGSEDWSEIRLSYTTGGKLTNKSITELNGVRVTTSYNQWDNGYSITQQDGLPNDPNAGNGAMPWKRKFASYDAFGNLIEKQIIWDDGSGKRVDGAGNVLEHTRVDANGDTETVKYATDGSKTGVIRTDGDNSEEWQRIELRFDANGDVTFKSVTNSDGILTSVEQTAMNNWTRITKIDGLIFGYGDSGSAPWYRKVQDTDTNGVVRYKSTTMDNGDSVSRYFSADGILTSLSRYDADQSESWQSLSFQYFDDGSLDTRSITKNNGDIETKQFRPGGSLSSLSLVDGDGSEIWHRLTYTYTSSGNLLTLRTENSAFSSQYEEKTFNDAGVLIRLVQQDGIYEQSMHDWSKVTSVFDGDGVLQSKHIELDNYGASASTVYNADGSRVVTAQDGSAHNSQHAWHTKVSTFAADGSLASVNRTMDSGEQTETGFDAAGNIISTTVFDHADAFIWSSKAKSFDAAGAQIGDTVTYDDGRISETTYVNGIRTQRVVTDTGDAVGWQTKTFDYNDTTGALEQIIRLMDDGTSETESFLI
ncbi:MAG: hypothetical protein N4A70_07840 [Pelagimonas sp.]|nr:hypothetical protein [Pelagimonas sp.]